MFDYKYHAGRRRFRGKKGFYRRLVFYMILAIFLMVVNLFTFSGTLWFPWALMGLGIDLLVKYFQVFGFPGAGPTDEDWEAREMEREMRSLGPGRPEEDELELRELERPKRQNWSEDELV